MLLPSLQPARVEETSAKKGRRMGACPGNAARNAPKTLVDLRLGSGPEPNVNSMRGRRLDTACAGRRVGRCDSRTRLASIGAQPKEEEEVSKKGVVRPKLGDEIGAKNENRKETTTGAVMTVRTTLDDTRERENKRRAFVVRASQLTDKLLDFTMIVLATRLLLHLLLELWLLFADGELGRRRAVHAGGSGGGFVVG